MLRKFVGDKMSIEATSRDGRLWEIQLFDRGHLTKYTDTSEADLNLMAAKKGMRLVPGRR
jgi:hypothetical protein